MKNKWCKYKKYLTNIVSNLLTLQYILYTLWNIMDTLLSDVTYEIDSCYGNNCRRKQFFKAFQEILV